MKATVFFKDFNTRASRRKTVNVEENEPNLIIRTFVKEMKVSKYTYVTHVKCGRYDYQWFGDCIGAGIY